MLARNGGGACPVCGWVHDDPAKPSTRFCACCGIERGVQDRSSDQVKSWRAKWLMSGGLDRRLGAGDRVAAGSGGRWRGPVPLADEPGTTSEPDPFSRRL